VDRGDVAVHDGADSFVIENGQVVVQTIHYTLSVRNPKALEDAFEPTFRTFLVGFRHI
jgi:hypothetical protein